MLLAHGAAVDAREAWHGQTALMWAAAQHHPDMLRLLVEHGADPLGEDQDGVTPIGAAEGGLSGRGRGAADTYPETAAALRALAAPSR